MAGILISPKVDVQIRNRNAAYRKKYGAPNFRDILRQRFRDQIKNRRGALFTHLRQLNSEDEVRSALSDMMRSDMNDINFDSADKQMETMDCATVLKSSVDNQEYLELENEFTQEDRYIMEMYEQLLESEQTMIDALLEDEVICPLCEKGVLKEISGTLRCSLCPAIVNSNASPSHVKQLIYSGLSTHNQFCSDKATFAVFHEDSMNGLFLICDKCAYYIQII